MNKTELLPHWDMADIAYEGKATIKDKYGKDVRFFEYKSDIAYGYADAENVYVVFRGSDDLRDWAMNLWAWPKKGVHKGFWYPVNSMMDGIVAFLALHQGKNLYVEGHSRGGGEGDVFIRLFLQAHPNMMKSVKGIFFGSPRVMQKRFIERNPVPKGTVYYVDNGDDIVTRMPPRFINRFYRDGHVIEIGDQMSKEEVRKAVLKAVFLRDFSILEELNDHKSYRASLTG